MGAMTPEGKVKKKLTDMLKRHKVWYFYPVSNGLGRGGIPDVIAIVDGQFVGIECKADKTKQPSALQMKCGVEIKDAGGYWFLIYDDLTIEQLEKWILTWKVR